MSEMPLTYEQFLAQTNGPKTRANYDAYLRLTKMFEIDATDYRSWKAELLAELELMSRLWEEEYE